MNYATYVALTNYATPAAALAAKPTDGQAWLLNEPQVFQDARMPKSGPASVKKDQQLQKARTLAPTISRNKASTSGTVGAGYQSSLKDGVAVTNKRVVSNGKAPSIRNMVTWHVTDSNVPAGYRRVTGVLQDPATTSPYRDDDAQVRI